MKLIHGGVFIHPGRLTWNLQITHCEKNMIFQTSMIMFHVNLQGCTLYSKAPALSTPGRWRIISHHQDRWHRLSLKSRNQNQLATTFVKKMKGANLNSCQSIIQKIRYIYIFVIEIYALLYLNIIVSFCQFFIYINVQAKCILGPRPHLKNGNTHTLPPIPK